MDPPQSNEDSARSTFPFGAKTLPGADSASQAPSGALDVAPRPPWIKRRGPPPPHDSVSETAKIRGQLRDRSGRSNRFESSCWARVPALSCFCGDRPSSRVHILAHPSVSSTPLRSQAAAAVHTSSQACSRRATTTELLLLLSASCLTSRPPSPPQAAAMRALLLALLGVALMASSGTFTHPR